ncbi:hypothetical protein GCM10023331_03690 [Algivirga pacifica]|uniref:LamG-like jellyroll fold domain-containing protein n=2 Tax=Algivirga pacifica TaxID=1162670 RepID=A0ABP9CYA5_9BACT
MFLFATQVANAMSWQPNDNMDQLDYEAKYFGINTTTNLSAPGAMTMGTSGNNYWFKLQNSQATNGNRHYIYFMLGDKVLKKMNLLAQNNASGTFSLTYDGTSYSYKISKPYDSSNNTFAYKVEMSKNFFNALKNNGEYLGFSYYDIEAANDGNKFHVAVSTVPYRSHINSNNGDVSAPKNPTYKLENGKLVFEWETPDDHHFGVVDYQLFVGTTSVSLPTVYGHSGSTSFNFGYSGKTYRASFVATDKGTIGKYYKLTINNATSSDNLYKYAYNVNIKSRPSMGSFSRGGNSSSATYFEPKTMEDPISPTMQISDNGNGTADVTLSWSSSSPITPYYYTYGFRFDYGQTIVFEQKGYIYNTTWGYWYYKKHQTGQISGRFDYSRPSDNMGGNYSVKFSNLSTSSEAFENLSSLQIYTIIYPVGGRSYSASPRSNYNYFKPSSLDPSDFKVSLEDNSDDTFDVKFQWKSTDAYPHSFFNYRIYNQSVITNILSDNQLSSLTASSSGGVHTWTRTVSGVTYTMEYDENEAVYNEDGSRVYNITVKNVDKDDSFLASLPNLVLRAYTPNGSYYSNSVDYTVEQSEYLSEVQISGNSSGTLSLDGVRLPTSILEFYLYSDDVNAAQKVTSISSSLFTNSDTDQLWTVQAKVKGQDGWLTKKAGLLVTDSEAEINFRGCDRLGVRFNELTLPTGTSGTVEYRIKRKEDGVDNSFLTQTTQSGTTYEDTQTAANSLYSYQVDIINSNINATGSDYQSLVYAIDLSPTTGKASMANMPSVINKTAYYNADSVAINAEITFSGGEFDALQKVSVYRVTVSTGQQSATKVLYDRDNGGMDANDGTITTSKLSYWDGDASLQNCESYIYTFILEDDCSTEKQYATEEALISADISDTFNEEKNLEATVGFYEDYVELEWQNDNNELVEDFSILRALYISDNDADLEWFEIESVDASTHQFIDRTGQAGRLYKYKVVANIPCNGVVSELSSYVQVGFRAPRGIISGHIEYSGGQEVKDVRVQVTHVNNSDRGSALQLENGDLFLPDSAANAEVMEVLKTNDFTVEMWLKPDKSNNNQDNYAIMALGDSTKSLMKMYNDSDQLDVLVNNGTGTAVADFSVVKDEWHQYTLVSIGDSSLVRVYYDGSLIASYPTIALSSMLYSMDVNDPVYFLKGYNGSVEELRLWKYAKSAEEVEKDYSRITNNQGNELAVYYNFDEGVGVMAYDQSKNDDNIFNERHVQGTGTVVQWLKGSFIPTTDQLGYVGYTDEFGNHIVHGIRYMGSGESFKAIPNKGVHEFSPSSRVVYIGDGGRAVNGVDFEDISSFVVKGTVTYDEDTDPENTSLNIPVEGGMVKINGEPIIYQGQQVYTKEDGSFEVEVPIGEHLLTIEKDGHTFRNVYTTQTLLGEDSIYYKVEDRVKFLHDFQEPIYTLEFKDMTRVVVIGKVVGGVVEASKDLIFGGTNNNIGIADITFTPQNVLYSSLETNIFTDTVSGEYRIELLPINYIASAPEAVNSTFSFDSENDKRLLSLGKLNVADLKYLTKEVPVGDASRSAFDALVDSGYAEIEDMVNENTIVVDSVRYTYPYHESANFMYSSTPVLEMLNQDESLPIIGASYIVTATDTIAVDTLNLDYPVFQQSDSMHYLFTAYEEYLNADGDSTLSTKYPVEGTVRLQNNIGSGGVEEVVLSYTDGDELSTGWYSFLVSEPNVAPPHLKSMSVELETATQTILWDNGGTNVLQGYVLGTKQVNGDFVTAGPDRVKWVLRDPPGSNSYAYLEEGSKLTEHSTVKLTDSFQSEFELLAADELNAKKSIFIGLGAGTVEEIFRLEMKTKSGTGFERDEGTSKVNVQELTTTIRQRIATSAASDAVGASADLFIGYAQNYKVGNTIGVEIQKNTDGSYGVDSLSVLGIQPADQTFFVYTQNHIVNFLLPDLVAVRNSYLENNPANYTSHFTKEEPFYGISNDNAIFGEDAVAFPAVEVPETGHSGESYTFIPSDEFPMDSVYLINLQIEEWVSAIRDNDAKKYLAKQQFDSDNNDDLLQDYSLSGGASLSYRESFEASQNYSKEWFDDYESYYAGSNDGKFAIFGIGLGFAQKSKYVTIKETSLKVGTLSANDVVWGFEYNDPNQGDKVNFKVTKPNFNKATFENMLIEESNELYNHNGSNWEAMGLIAANYVKTLALTKGLKAIIGTPAEYAATYGMMVALGEVVKQKDNVVNGAFNDSTVSDFEPPIFVLEGGVTSCPHEDATLSYYSIEYAEDGYTAPVELSGRTLQRDVPEISVGQNLKHQKIYNVPDDQPAVFTLNLTNLSESGDPREYSLKVLQGSNPNGAKITIDGIPPNRDFDIPAGTTLNKELTLYRGQSTLEYDSIMLVLHSPCQYWFGTQGNRDLKEIADTVYLSAAFLPTCTTPELEAPEQNWVVNSDGGDKLELEVAGYDINYYSLEKILLQYRRVGTTDWLPVTDPFYKQQASSVSGSGTTVYEYNEGGVTLYDSLEEKQWIPTTSATLKWNWELSNVADGEYEVRAVTFCHIDGQLSKEYTEVFSGTIDRELPAVFGQPSPSDGILGAGEELSISFNEDINKAMLGVTAQMDIRGQLNYSELKHNVSVGFDGLAQHVNIPFGPDLRKQNFTVEFWAKQEASGQKQVIISQGVQSAASWEIGFDENDALYMGINGAEKVAVMPAAMEVGWNHFAVSFNDESKVVELFVNGIWNNNTYNLPEEIFAEGPMVVGYRSYDQSTGFIGAVHELRVWNHTRNGGNLTEYMNTTLSGQEAGLTGYWPMDELGENLLVDKARNRNAEMNAAWALEREGYAYDLAAIDTLSINASTIGFTNEQEYTIEFWFKSNTLDADATLFSNGKGTAEAYNTEGWSVNLLSSGKLQLANNGQTVEAEGNYGDNKWHHFAMAYSELSGMNIYMDGILKANQKEGFSGFAGSTIYFGNRYHQNGTILELDQTFDGLMDEIRIWNTKRTDAQVKRYKNQALAGDELGLLVYFSFEQYMEVNGITQVTTKLGSETSLRTDALTISPLGNYFTQEGPLVQVEPAVEKVPFTYVADERQIIFTLDIEPKRVEGVILDLSVSHIEDMFGNLMDGTATWSVYIDQNRLIWNKVAVSQEKQYGEALSFNVQVLNKSGEVENFDLSNIPDWITATPSFGVLDPQSYTDITFEVHEGLPVGNYTEDIMLTGNIGYAEKLQLDVKVYEETPDWTVNEEDYEVSMHYIGMVKVGEVISRDEDDILAAFVGDEVRGITKLKYIPSRDSYMAFLTVYGNAGEESDLEFKLWDASEGRIRAYLSPTNHTFEQNATRGTVSAPVEFVARDVYEHYVSLNKGWNWVSFNLKGDDMGINKLFPESQQSKIVQVKDITDNLFSEYSTVDDSLKGIIDTIQVDRTYFVYTNEESEFSYIGTVVDPSKYKRELKTGWNAIGFISRRPLLVSEALSSLTPNTGDLIKSRTGFAMYEDQLGWIGSLDFMEVGEGFMLYTTTSADTLEYPQVGMFDQNALRRATTTMAHPWELQAMNTEYNMTTVLSVEGIEVDTETIVGAFVGEECIAVARGIENAAWETPRFFLTLPGNFTEEVTFQVYDATSDAVLQGQESLTFKANQHVGTLQNPLQVTFEQLNESTGLTVYPTIAEEEVTIQYQLDADGPVEIIVTDLLGKVVKTFTNDAWMGETTRIIWNAKGEGDNHLSTGMYLITLRQGDVQMTQKVILK